MSSESNNCGNKACRNLGLFRCSRCKNVFYCSQKCQKISWKDHKVSCSESRDTGTSSHHAAQRTIGTCHNEECAKIGALICSQCKNVGYCSKECQKVDWGSHKRNCKGSVADTSRESLKGQSNLPI